MRILITGAAGFLGSYFLDHFIRAEAGHDVWSVDIKQHPTRIPIDVVDLEAWLADFDENVDVVFHFAAPVGGRMKIEHDPMYNADAFRLDSVMFRWAVKHAKLVVYPSSSAIYPVGLQGVGNSHLLFEDFIRADRPTWSAPDELYGFSKLAGEMMAWKAATKHGLDVLCIRPFSGYGPGQSDDYPMPSILRRAIARENPLVVWGSGRQRRDFVYVTDIVGATLAKLNDGIRGYEVMNIASGRGIDFIQIAKIAAGIVGYSPDVIGDESRPTGVMDRVGSTGRMDPHYKLGTHLQDGITQTIEWLRNPPPVNFEPEQPIVAQAVIVGE